jgi:hypothetical protein
VNDGFHLLDNSVNSVGSSLRIGCITGGDDAHW